MRTIKQDLDHARLKLAEFQSTQANVTDARTVRWVNHKVIFWKDRVAELEAEAGRAKARTTYPEGAAS